jgi:hypothetical protein
MANLWPILQTSVAASLAYLLAAFALGREEPFFAPIAAVATLGSAPGQRGGRAVEVALGVAVGLAIADVNQSGGVDPESGGSSSSRLGKWRCPRTLSRSIGAAIALSSLFI